MFVVRLMVKEEYPVERVLGCVVGILLTWFSFFPTMSCFLYFIVRELLQELLVNEFVRNRQFIVYDQIIKIFLNLIFMSARDTYHEAIKNALIKDSWMIIRDPYTIKYEEIQLFADLLADRTLEIERNGQQIIVEIKSFIGRSPMREFETALGQYIIYRTLLKVILPKVTIYLGVSRSIYQSFFLQKAISFIMAENDLKLIVVDLNKEEIVQWIN
jgi:hypothetical protein